MTFYCNEVDYNTSGDNSQNVSVKLYEAEWKYLSNITDINELRDPAIRGELRNSRYRSICWRILLEILPLDSTDWLMVIQESRFTYERIKLIHYNDPHTQDFGLDDPLSQDDDSVWKQYFMDNELKKTIQLDVVRTSPGVEFFRTEKIQKIMIDVLFCYSRENPDLCYRQGMHEILAPLLFVLHCDHQALLHVLEQSTSDVSDLIKKILDPAYLEADVYSLFNTIMKIMKDYYTINNTVDSVSEPSERVIKTTNSTAESEVVRKLTIIRDKMLAIHDPELNCHLLSLDISFTTFGVRWLRLLFGGEFSLMDLLVLWDVIFSKPSQNFALVNYVFVAMLVLIRVQLLKSDHINCLNYLMRYPLVDVMSVIEYALNMFDPKVYPLPAVIISLKQDKSDTKINITDKKPERPSSIVSNYSGRQMHDSSDDLLDLCRIKLLQYHSILSPVVPKNNKDARQALIGMLELCGMIDSRPGVIEMGKDVARSTTPMTPNYMPEITEEGPLLPPPASAITMTLFRQTKKSVDSLIQGAPTKNPLKQMKRYQQDDIEAVHGMSVSKIQKVCTGVPSNERVVQENMRDDRPIYAVEDNGAESDADEDGQFYSLVRVVDDSDDNEEADEGFYSLVRVVDDSEDARLSSLLRLIDDSDEEDDSEDGQFSSLARVVDDSDDNEDGGSYFLMHTVNEDDENVVEVDKMAETDTDEHDDDVNVDVITISDDSCENWPTASNGYSDRRTAAVSEPIRVKRPLNAYMLWSLAERRKITDKRDRNTFVELSKRLGATWRRMNDQERRPFVLEAARLKELYHQKYPDYMTRRRRRRRMATKTA